MALDRNFSLLTKLETLGLKMNISTILNISKYCLFQDTLLSQQFIFTLYRGIYTIPLLITLKIVVTLMPTQSNRGYLTMIETVSCITAVIYGESAAFK